ncbi:hypothetical protein [Granulicella sibirica]|uniref:Uncharacterized protein n=1 Tax=Granulicella sibirica TaxID=2479048 RepID=A0A4Q0SZA3_9BACT|nr:hypothetical protein [Granulicella sibirica]RXH54406.1 hypothetical protein GRAN_4702 [Granulicella sibirica]
MLKLLLFCLLLVVCWPLALLAVVLYPLIWLILLPFRLLGIVVGGVFHLIEAIFLFPLLILRPRRSREQYPPRIGYGRQY